MPSDTIHRNEIKYRSNLSPYQLRLRYGTASRLFELRSKLGFGGILSSISEREPARDRLSEHGNASETVVSFSNGTVESRSRGEAGSRDSTPLEECEMAFPGIDSFGVGTLPVKWCWEQPLPGSSRLAIAGTEDLEPSSMSKRCISIVCHNGNLWARDLEGWFADDSNVPATAAKLDDLATP